MWMILTFKYAGVSNNMVKTNARVTVFVDVILMLWHSGFSSSESDPRERDGRRKDCRPRAVVYFKFEVKFWASMWSAQPRAHVRPPKSCLSDARKGECHSLAGEFCRANANWGPQGDEGGHARQWSGRSLIFGARDSRSLHLEKVKQFSRQLCVSRAFPRNNYKNLVWNILFITRLKLFSILIY
jgi:hypothetical protein